MHSCPAPLWRLTRRRAVLFLGLSLLDSTSAATQEPVRSSPDLLGTTAELSLASLYARVESSSPRVAAARSLADAVAARVPATRRPPDPRVQLGLMNYSLPSVAPMDVIGMRQVQVMQMLPLFGKLRLNTQIAESQAEGARARALEVTWEQRSRVATAFYDLYRIDRTVAVTTDTRRLLDNVAATAQSMYAVGEGRQSDVLRARIEVARMTEELVRMASMRTAMASRLSGLLDAPLDTTHTVPILPQLPDSLPAPEVLVGEAERSRPMIRAGEADERAAQTTERLARREIWPELEVGVQLGQQRGPMGVERMGSLMLGASIPVFARSRQSQMPREAAAMRAMTRADLAAMRADTRARVLEVYADFTRARNLRALYRTTILPQAEAATMSSLAAYRTGAVDLMTLLDNQMTVNRYRQELFALEGEQGQAIAELEMLVGRALFDVNTRAPREER